MRVMVTGSNRGIGLEYVRQLLGRGEHVFATCRQPEQAQDLQNLKNQYGDMLSIVKMEVTNANSVEQAHDDVSSQVEALDVIINNAAINFGDEVFGELKKENFMQAFEVNVVGVMLVSQQFADLLQKGENPRLVNISSGAGSLTVGAPPTLYSYNVSKTALNMLNMMLHKALSPQGVTCIALNPGWVVTDMGGPDADLKPEDSIRQQLAVIDGLTSANSGHFKDYAGGELAW